MSEALAIDTQDDGEPPSSERDSFITSIVTLAEGDTPWYASYTVGRQETRLTVTDASLVAQIGAAGCKAYVEMSTWQRHRLEDEIIDSMVLLANDDRFRDGRALCNAVPIMFEPTRYEMLLGERDMEDDAWMRVEGHDISTHEQRRLLMGGLAVLLWHIEQAID